MNENYTMYERCILRDLCDKAITRLEKTQAKELEKLKNGFYSYLKDEKERAVKFRARRIATIKKIRENYKNLWEDSKNE